MPIRTSQNYKNLTTINYIVNGEDPNEDVLNRPIKQLKNMLEQSTFEGSISSIAIPVTNTELRTNVEPLMIVKAGASQFEKAKKSDEQKIVGIVNSNRSSITVAGLFIDKNLDLKTGTLYYLDDDSKLTTTVTDVFIGIGLDKNTLLLKI